MTVGDVSALPHKGRYDPRLTTQQIADFMLQQDRMRRDAIRAGNLSRATECDAELDKLQGLLP